MKACAVIGSQPFISYALFAVQHLHCALNNTYNYYVLPFECIYTYIYAYLCIHVVGFKQPWSDQIQT